MRRLSTSSLPRIREAEYSSPNSNLDGPSEMWALGCLFLEIITWILCGLSSVRQLQADRRQENAGHPAEYFQFGRTMDKDFSATFYGRDSNENTWYLKKSVIQVGRGVSTSMTQTLTFIQHIYKLREAAHTEIFRTLLDLVENDLLVIDASKRITAQELVTKLLVLIEMR